MSIGWVSIEDNAGVTKGIDEGGDSVASEKSIPIIGSVSVGLSEG